MKRRKLAISAASVGLVITLALTLTACDPPAPEVGGISGITANDRGQLIGLVQMCKGSVHEAVLFAESGQETTLASPSFPRSEAGFYSFPLGSAAKIGAFVRPQAEYDLQVVGSRWGAAVLRFRGAAVSQISPDKVLAPKLTGSGYPNHSEFVSLAAFRSEACPAYAQLHE